MGTHSYLLIITLKIITGGAGRGAPTKGSPCLSAKALASVDGYSWEKTRDRTRISLFSFLTIAFLGSGLPRRTGVKVGSVAGMTDWIKYTNIYRSDQLNPAHAISHKNTVR